MMTADRMQRINNKEVFISCIVPVFNEGDLVQLFFKELQAALHQLTHHFEIIVVDDGSQDVTAQNILALPAEYKIKLISFSRNFGKEIALSAGLVHSQGEIAILMDGDFQHPIELLPSFIAKWGEGFDMVYGVRQNRDTEPQVKRYLSRLFYWIMAKITSIHIPNNAGDFRLLDRKVINSLNDFKERTRFMKGLYAWVGFKKTAVAFTVQKRALGKSSWGLIKLTELALTGITSFSDLPLRIWSLIGFIISFISLIYAIYIVAVTLIYGADLPGFPTLAAAIMFFGGIQLLSIGILGEYIARVFTEVKQRPPYIIAFKSGFDDLNK